MFVNFRIKCNITPPTKENPLCYNKTHKNNNQKPPAITPLKVAYIITAPNRLLHASIVCIQLSYFSIII